MESLDEEQLLKIGVAINKYVIPGYQNGIGKPSIIAQVVNAGFDKELAVDVVDRYEPSPGQSAPLGRPSRVDCSKCGAKSVFVTKRGDFAIGWFLLLPVIYLVYHFGFKSSGGCSNCGVNLSKR